MFTIITDSSSDIMQNEAARSNVYHVYLPVIFEKMNYRPDLDDNFNEFYHLLERANKLPTTSQPAVDDYLKLFTEAANKGDDVLVITISSGISGTYNSAITAKAISGYENIYVVDSMQATISQRILVDYAVHMRDTGRSAAETAEAIAEARSRVTLFGLLDTLTYLKKGGRIPPSLAVVGNALGIKAAVILTNGKVEQLGKSRGFNNGKKFLWSEFEKDEFDREWPIYFGYARDRQAGEQFMKETSDRYGLSNVKILPIGSVIGTHVGPGAVAIAYVNK